MRYAKLLILHAQVHYVYTKDGEQSTKEHSQSLRCKVLSMMHDQKRERTVITRQDDEQLWPDSKCTVASTQIHMRTRCQSHILFQR